MMDDLHRAQHGDPDATERLLQQHTRLIASIARRYAGRTPVEDLMQEGRVAFLSAVRTYNPSFGCRFSTHVGYRVRGAILHYLRDRADMVRVPAKAQEQGVRSPLIGDLEMAEDCAEGDRMEERVSVRTTLQRLSKRDQALLWAVGVEGRTFPEVAAVLGVHPNTANRWYQNSVLHFRRMHDGATP